MHLNLKNDRAFEVIFHAHNEVFFTFGALYIETEIYYMACYNFIDFISEFCVNYFETYYYLTCKSF